MRVLILSCDTGEGHNAAGKAVTEWIKKMGHEAVMIDIMMLSGRRTSRIVGGCYVNLVKCAPTVFRVLYWAGSKISSARRKSPVYYANMLMAKPLKRYLDKNQFDVIVTPHLFAAETLTYMKHKEMLKQKTVAIATDYTCIPFWEETDCDYYIAPHPDIIEEYVKKGMDRTKILPYGIPVRLDFQNKTEKEQARRSCGLPEDKPACLVMSGSMGFGKVQLFVSELSFGCHCGEQIVVVCGNNRRLEDSLREKFQRNKNIHILGYTNQVSLYMDACDIVFTKPGGLTSTEAAVKRIPIVHTAPIPGCETKNMKFFTEKGMSLASCNIRGQIRAGWRLLQQNELREKISRAQEKNISPDAAKQIVDLLLRLCGEE